MPSVSGSFIKVRLLPGGGSDDRITSDTDGGRDSHASPHDLVGSFVSQGSGFGDDTDFPGFEHTKPGMMPTLHSPAVITRAIRPDETGLFVGQVFFYLIISRVGIPSVIATTSFDAGFRLRFHDRIGCKSRRARIRWNIRTGLADRIGYRVEDRRSRCEVPPFLG